MRKPLIWVLLLLIITFLVILVVVILLVLLWKGEKVLGWRSFIATHLYHLFPLSCLVIDNIVTTYNIVTALAPSSWVLPE